MKPICIGKTNNRPEVIFSVGFSPLFIEMLSAIFKLPGKVRFLRPLFNSLAIFVEHVSPYCLWKLMGAPLDCKELLFRLLGNHNSRAKSL